MPLTSTLFHGAKFWLSLNVPQRPRFKEMIKVSVTSPASVVIIQLRLLQDHGGIIVLRQKDADVQLVDHKMKSLPPETYGRSLSISCFCSLLIQLLLPIRGEFDSQWAA